MSVTVEYGRLCNQIIRNVAVSLIAEKHNLHVSYSSYDRISRLGIPLYIGSNRYDSSVDVYNNSYFDILSRESLPHNINANNDFFQTKDITNHLYTWFRAETTIRSIIHANPFKDRYKQNNDCFIHIRLGDVAHLNPGLTYYINAIKALPTIDTIYVGTDSPEHSILVSLKELYPNLQILSYDEVETIQFASTCKNVILSHGSYSAVIGYISIFSDIYYPMYESNKMWHGDIFSIPDWNRVEF